MQTFQCAIITPYRLLFSSSVESVTFCSDDGEMELCAGHEPIVAPLRPGKVRLRGAEGVKVACVAAGFVAVRPGRADFFADAAEWPHEIDVERARAALERARRRLAESALPWELSRARAAVERARARIALASSRGGSA